MKIRKFIGFEIERISNKRYIAVILVFLVVIGYFLQYSIDQYKHILQEKNNFKDFERTQIKRVIYISQLGFYGARFLFVPSPLMAFFDGGPVPNHMTSFIDSSERIRFYQPLRGQNAFAKFNNLFMTFAGFILLFGSVLILLYGFLGSKDHEWLKFLEELVGGRRRLFLYQIISRAFLLLFFCLIIALLSTIFFVINGVAVNLGWILIFSQGIFMMFLFFLIVGLIAGTLKSRFGSWVSMAIVWFLLVSLMPVLIYHWTYKRAASIKSPYKMESMKQNIFMDYEKSSLQDGGKFDESKYGNEKEIEMFLDFWNGGFKRVMVIEKNMIEEIKPHISFYQNASALFPSTFFLSVSNEISSKGFSNLVRFSEYTQEKKKDFIWFIASISILSRKKITQLPSFIKGNENIYQGKSQLPDNYGFGLMANILWLVLLFIFYWITFNRMLDRSPETKRILNLDELKRNRTNIIFTSDKGLLFQFISELRLQKIAFASVPAPSNLPGDVKVKNLYSFLGLTVPEGLRGISGQYVYNLETDDKGLVLSEIVRSLKLEVIIFDNFLNGLSDDLINHYAEVLGSLKKGKKIVYFTNSLKVADEIGDYVIRYNKEKQPF